MIEIKSIDTAQMMEYINPMVVYGTQNAFTNVDMVEVQNYFGLCVSDTFLMIKCTGSPDELERELRYVNIPEKNYGKMIIIRGEKNLTLNDMVDVQSKIGLGFCPKERAPLLTWYLKEGMERPEILLFVKVFEPRNILTENYFESLWEAVLQDLDATGVKGCKDALKDVQWKIRDNVLELYAKDNTRAAFFLHVKKQEIEDKIFSYTGKRLFITVK